MPRASAGSNRLSARKHKVHGSKPQAKRVAPAPSPSNKGSASRTEGFPFSLLSSFLSIQVFALIVGVKFVLDQLSIVDDSSDIGNSLSFFAYILAAAVALLVVLYFYKGRLLFKLMEYGLLFSASLIALSSFVPEQYALALGAAVMALRAFVPASRNVLLVGVAAVVGAMLGSSLDIVPAVLLAVLLSAYDYIAVFKTKHMIVLAEELYDRGAAFAVSLGSQKQQIELGTGDLVVSSMLSVSALKIGSQPNLVAAFFVIAGGVAGFFVLFEILRSRKGYLPALPPLVACSLAGLGFYYLLAPMF